MKIFSRNTLAFALLASSASFTAQAALNSNYTINYPERAERVFKLPVDAGQQYTLSGAHANAFEIEDGQFLAFKNAPVFNDADGINNYSVTVTQTSASQGTTASLFNVNVYDVQTGAFENMAYPETSTEFKTGQDREYVKLDADGIPLADQNAKNHTCVIDGANGLWWEVKDAPQAATPKADRTAGESPRDVYDRFTYFENGVGVENARNNRDCYGYQAGNPATYCNTSAYSARMNTAKLCGKSNWRTPTGDHIAAKLWNTEVSNNKDISKGDNETEAGRIQKRKYAGFQEIRMILTDPNKASSGADTYTPLNYFPNTRPSHYTSISAWDEGPFGSLFWYTGDLACISNNRTYNWTIFFSHGSNFMRGARNGRVSAPCKASSRHHIRVVRTAD